MNQRDKNINKIIKNLNKKKCGTMEDVDRELGKGTSEELKQDRRAWIRADIALRYNNIHNPGKSSGESRATYRKNEGR